MQTYLQAIINLDMYIRGGGGQKKIINLDKLQSLSLQNHQYAQCSYYIVYLTQIIGAGKGFKL